MEKKGFYAIQLQIKIIIFIEVKKIQWFHMIRLAKYERFYSLEELLFIIQKSAFLMIKMEYLKK